MPPIDLKDTSGVELEKLIAEVSDKEVEEAIGRIAEQNDYEAKAEGAKAEAATG